MAITNNLTSMRGKYIVLKLDFSALHLDGSLDPASSAKSFDAQFTKEIVT
jgi:hypothetical protein